YPPVAVDDAGSAAGSRRAAESEVVLRAPKDVIERRRIVYGHIVKLCDWQVALEMPISCTIVTLINSAVTADEIMIGVVGIDPDFVIVDVLGFFAQTAQCSSAVIGNHQKNVHHIKAIDVF